MRETERETETDRQRERELIGNLRQSEVSLYQFILKIDLEPGALRTNACHHEKILDPPLNHGMDLQTV